MYLLITTIWRFVIVRKPDRYTWKWIHYARCTSNLLCLKSYTNYAIYIYSYLWGAVLIFLRYFLISDNDFLYKKIRFLISKNNSWYKKKEDFWYQKSFSDIKNSNLWYQKIISWYQEIQFLISENKVDFFLYQK